jgi:hypothetical protein
MPRRRLPPPLLRRALLRVLLFAAIGAGATVLVAWFCLHGHIAAIGTFESEGPLEWVAPVPRGWPKEPLSTSWATYTAKRVGLHRLQLWRFEAAHHEELNQLRISCGLPLLAMTGYANASDAGSSVRGFVSLPGASLPILPLWPGFLVDTAFWGGAAFLVCSVPGFVRRRARRRRGRCVRCGYELAGVGGGVCPECGDSGEPQRGPGL